MTDDWIKIDRLRGFGVIGLHDWERERKQEMWIDASLQVDLSVMGETDQVEHGLNYGDVATELLLHAESAERFTIEALATDLAGICLNAVGVERVIVEVSKPGADPHARRIAVRISRAAGEMLRRACIGLGSNRDAEENLVRAVDALASIGEVKAVSSVYQTPAVGNSGQSDYLNAAAMLETPLPAGALQRKLKRIERSLGRDKTDNASGVLIDLDLCLLGGQVVRTGDVFVPAQDILEKAYLARTLSELSDDLKHPETGEPLGSIAARLDGVDSLHERNDVRLSLPPRGQT